jgi:hypothetical protein
MGAKRFRMGPPTFRRKSMGAKRLRDGCADGCDASATRKNQIFKQVIIIYIYIYFLFIINIIYIEVSGKW